MYRLPVSSCLLLACLLTQVGCATRETVVDAPTQRSWVEPGTPSNYFASTSAAKDELSFQLQATSCTNTEVTQLISDAREYKKSTFIAGPGLMIGGALAGAASVPVFASASENPATCAEDDEECVSEEDALATGYLLAGLGAAGIAVGAYNTFKEPVVLRSWQQEAGAPARIASDCTLPTQNVPVALVIDDQVIGTGTTDDNGWVSWTAPDNVVGTLPQVSAALSIGTQPPQLIPIDLSAAIQQAAQRELDAVIAREEELAEQGESSEADIPQRPHGWLDQAQYAVWVWLRDHQPECTLMLEDTIDWGVQWSVNSVNVRVATGILRLFAVQNELLRWIVKQAAKKYGDDAILLVLNQVAPQLLQDFLNALAALRSATAGTVCAVARDVIRPTAT